MCDPLTIAGIALTAGSIVTNSVADGERTRARDNVLVAERMRQQTLDQEAQALNAVSQDRYVNFEPQQQERADQLGDYLQQNVAPDANSAAGTVMPSSSSDIVNDDLDQQQGEAQEYVDQQTGALADLRSFGDLLGETSLMQGRDAGLIGQIGGFKRGSSGVVPFELDHASEAGDGWNLFGDILAGAGSIATGAGLTGGSANLSKMFGAKSAFPTPMPRPGWYGG